MPQFDLLQSQYWKYYLFFPRQYELPAGLFPQVLAVFYKQYENSFQVYYGHIPHDPRFFYDFYRICKNILIGRITILTFNTFAPAADTGSLMYRPGINHFRILIITIGALHL